jgi:cyclophilin family peptidyl-prolyl cis-trans isomerase
MLALQANLLLLLVSACHYGCANAWVTNESSRLVGDVLSHHGTAKNSEQSRRHFLSLAVGASSLLVCPTPSTAVTRAIGTAEAECRAAGNCLETFDLDGAVGWSWGGKDRCDATDPRCANNGQLLDAAPTGEAVPVVANKITHVVAVSFVLARTEYRSLRLGLYGDDAPASVTQFLQFVTSGLSTTSSLVFENGMGIQSIPVSMTRGGILGQIVPSQRLDFGIPSQAAGYARSKGMSKAEDEFLAQPRPRPIEEAVIRKHDAAGLLSVPEKGIGYGGTGFESDDECFESAFEITATAVPAMDKERRRVIGQVMDQESMATLARLASLPTKKGFKGVIPGQNSGPPLLKVAIESISASMMPVS